MCKNSQKVKTETHSSLWRYGDGQNKAQVEAQTIKHEKHPTAGLGVESPREKYREQPERKKSLVIEASVHVLSEQCLPDGREGVNLQETQTLLEGVVDLDLALTTDNNHTTSTVEVIPLDLTL
jgi:hypothetical protein